MTDWRIERGISVLTEGRYTANVWVTRQINVGPAAKFEWAVGPTKTGLVERHGYAATCALAESAAEAALAELVAT